MAFLSCFYHGSMISRLYGLTKNKEVSHEYADTENHTHIPLWVHIWHPNGYIGHISPWDCGFNLWSVIRDTPHGLWHTYWGGFMTLKQLQAFENFVEDYLVHIMDRDQSSKMIWKYSEEKFLQEIGTELASFNMTALEVMSCLGAAFDRYKRRSQ